MVFMDGRLPQMMRTVASVRRSGMPAAPSLAPSAGDTPLAACTEIAVLRPLLQVVDDFVSDRLYSSPVSVHDEVGYLPIQRVANLEQGLECATSIAVLE